MKSAGLANSAGEPHRSNRLNEYTNYVHVQKYSRRNKSDPHDSPSCLDDNHPSASVFVVVVGHLNWCNCVGLHCNDSDVFKFDQFCHLSFVHVVIAAFGTNLLIQASEFNLSHH
jgi:hypothetical protein